MRACAASDRTICGLTYVVQQLGNSPAVVLKGSGTKTWNHEAKMPALHASDIAQLADSENGEPWWDRTTDPLIKSQVLYQLS